MGIKEVAITFALFSLASCIKDELPVPISVQPGLVVSDQVCIGSTYGQQVFYDIGTNSTVSSNDQGDWDLAFSSDSAVGLINLNTGRGMRVRASGLTDFNLVTDTAVSAQDWRYDFSSGHTDSLALEMLAMHSEINIVDMGYTALGLHLGYRKLIAQNASDSYVRIIHGPLSAGSQYMDTIELYYNTAQYMNYVSLSANAQVTIEPDQDEFDLVFTQYQNYFPAENLHYLVTGVLSAHHGVRVAQINNAVFEEVSLNDSLQNPFGTERDIIGYDWKIFDFANNLFITNPSMVFLVKDAHGSFYKMRFTDFYDNQGNKGCPSFDIVAF